ncbi:MAG: hypothetical protein H0U74_05100 [Bradymonadaceae bacterium]|nr:hypothetical protein [Lujinxingiaceae bacterium]
MNAKVAHVNNNIATKDVKETRTIMRLPYQKPVLCHHGKLSQIIAGGYGSGGDFLRQIPSDDD